MPTSNPYAISTILREVKKLHPKSILDLGVGFGKWGVLFRELLDIWHWRIFPDEWQVVIDGVEGYSKYLNPIHKYVYNNFLIADIRELKWDDFPTYDLICLFDVIEHMPKVQGYDLLHVLLPKANKALFISTPVPEDFTPSRHGRWQDDLEGHIDGWSPQELEENFGARIIVCESKERGYRTFLAEIFTS